jgi:CHAT domain-containing protein/Tfp pilus assembly protein PilF
MPETMRRLPLLVQWIVVMLVLVRFSSPVEAQDARERIGNLNVATVQLLNAGKVAEALANAEKALAEAERTLQPTDPLIGQSLNNVAVLLNRAGRHAEAEPVYKKSIAFREKVPGPGQADLATAQAEFGFWLYGRGRYADAEAQFRRGVAIREKALGADHDNTLSLSLDLVAALRELNRLAEAETLAKRVVAAREKKSGANHDTVADALSTLATIHRAQSRYTDVDADYQRMLTIRQAALGKEHAQVAMLLNSIAVNYEESGRFADADATYVRALALSEKALGGENRQVALISGNLSEFRRKQGRTAESLGLSQRALAIYEKVSGPDSRDAANALGRVGNALNAMKRAGEAEPYFRRSLAIREKIGSGDSTEIASDLSNLSVSLENQDRLPEAEALQRRAIAMNEKLMGSEHPVVAIMLKNLAITYDRQKRVQESEPLYKRALAIEEKTLGPNHPQVGDTLNYLGQIDLGQKRYAEGEAKFRRAIAIWEKTRGQNHPDVADALNNLGVLYGELGRLKDREQAEARALAIRQAAFGPEHYTVAQSLNNMAHAAEARGDDEQAETLTRRAVEMHEKLGGQRSSGFAATVRNLAAITNRRGKNEESLALIRRAAALGFVDKDAYVSIVSDAAVKKIVRGSEASDESFRIVQEGTASAAAGAVNKLAARFAAGSGTLADLVRSDQDLAAESEALDRRLIDALAQMPDRRDASAESAMRQQIEAIAAKRDAIRQRLTKEFPDYVALSRAVPVSLPDTKALLADDEALVLIDVEKSVIVFAMTREIAEVRRHANSKQADIGNLRALSKRVRDSIEQGLQVPDDKGMPAFDAAAAYEIYVETLKESEELIASKPKLAVILSGALTGIPPHLLVTSDPKGKTNAQIDWLIKRHEITIYPSVSAFKLARTKSAVARAPKPLMGYANPVFGADAPDAAKRGVAKPSLASFYTRGGVDLASLSRSLPPLPETEDELRSVGKTVKAAAADLKFGKAATEADVKRARLSDYRVLYFATHALVAGETALFVRNNAEPAIALTLPATATEADDGLLTASEIAQLKLNADWVVLSACNTASGDGNPGAEPLSGLARAFFYAGARSLLVSHWEVPSLSAVPLLVGIFEAKRANPALSNAGALRQSMLAYIENAQNPAWSHPVHWAAFVVVGDAK